MGRHGEEEDGGEAGRAVTATRDGEREDEGEAGGAVTATGSNTA